MTDALLKQQRLASFEKLQKSASTVLDFLGQVRDDRHAEAIDNGYRAASYTLYHLQRMPNMTRFKAETAIKNLIAEGRQFERLSASENITRPYVFSLDDVREIYKVAGEISHAEARARMGLPHQCKVIGNQNLKGGVGKTTSIVTIAAGLVHHRNLIRKRLRVLIIDMDPQGSTTASFGLNTIGQGQMHSAIEAINQQVDAETLLSWIQPTQSAGLSILPASSKDAFFSVNAYKIAAQQDLHVSDLLERNVIAPLKPFFDVILLDSGPHIDAALLNCLSASDALMVPVGLDPLELDSSVKFLSSLHSLLSELPNNKLSAKTTWLLPSKCDMNNPQHIDNLAMLSHLAPVKVLRARMDQLRPFSMVAEDGRTVFTIQPKHYQGDGKSLRRAQEVAEGVVQEFYATFLEETDV